MDILTQIENYRPYNEQEERDKGLILDCLRAFEDVFTRENALAHMTASAWVVNENRDKVLMAYHNIYHSWSWLGGHADGERDLLAVALREVGEMIYATHTGTLTESEVLLAKLQEIDGLRQQIDRLEREIARLQGGAVCPFCGAAARSGDVFCRECGQKL